MKAGQLLNIGFIGMDLKENANKIPKVYNSTNPYDSTMNTTLTLPKRSSEEEKVAIQEIDEIMKSAGLKLKIPNKVKELAGTIGRGIDKIDTNNTKNIRNAINAVKRKDVKSALKNVGKASLVTVPAVAGMVGTGIGTSKALKKMDKKLNNDSEAEYNVLGAGVAGALALNALAHKRVLMPSKNLINAVKKDAIKYPVKAIKKGSKAGKAIVDTANKVSKEGMKILKEQEDIPRIVAQQKRINEDKLNNVILSVQKTMKQQKVDKPNAKTFAVQMDRIKDKYYKDSRPKKLTDKEIDEQWKKTYEPEAKELLRKVLKDIGSKKAYEDPEFIEKIAASLDVKKNLAKDIFVDHFLKKGLESIPYYGAPAAVSYMISRDMKNGFKKIDKNTEKIASFREDFSKKIVKDKVKNALIRGAEVGADGLGRTIVPGALMVATGRNITNGFKPIDTDRDAVNSKEQFAKSIVININGRPTKKNINQEISKHMDEIKKIASNDTNFDVGDVLKNIRKINGEKTLKNRRIHIGNGTKKQFRLDT